MNGAWVLTRNQMPEEGTNVLIAYDKEYFNVIEVSIASCKRIPSSSYYEWYCEDSHMTIDDKDVIAWMSLPSIDYLKQFDPYYRA